MQWGRDEGRVLSSRGCPDASVRSCGRLGETDTRGEMRQAGAPLPLTTPGCLPRLLPKAGVSVDQGYTKGSAIPRRALWENGGGVGGGLLTAVLKEGFPGSAGKGPTAWLLTCPERLSVACALSWAGFFPSETNGLCLSSFGVSAVACFCLLCHSCLGRSCPKVVILSTQ